MSLRRLWSILALLSLVAVDLNAGGMFLILPPLPVVEVAEACGGHNECDDGKDNDGDGAIDYPADFGCSSENDDDESDREADCQDGDDNDGDGKTDYPSDPGCESPQDNNEYNPSLTECSDGKDNDGDGKIDALVELDSSNGEIQSWVGDNKGIRSFVNQKAAEFGFTPIPTQYHGQGMVSDDSTTADKVCELAGFSTVEYKDCHKDGPGHGRCNFDSCRDNVIGKWNSGLNDFQLVNACDAKYLSSLTCKHSLPACDDGIDNDGDGDTDYPDDDGCASKRDDSEIPHDPECDDPDDDSERDPECSDGQDNDGDGATDYPDDFSCLSPDDDDEENPKADCQDSDDNDGDGFTDYPLDPGCYSPQDPSEHDANGPECDNGEDDDGDGDIDYPDDSGCDSPVDDTERDYECSDGIDNDSDGATDYPDDFSCDSPEDDDESSPLAECQDGVDNDGDGETDYPDDPGCESLQDDSEKNPNGPECDNGFDDDSDGETDYPRDLECDGPDDDSEQARADLKVVSKTGPSDADLGETIEYNIKVKNLGPDKATNVVVADVVPTGFAFNSTQSDPSCVLNGNSVLCDNFNLNSGQSKTFTVAFDVVSDNLCDTTVTNTATVSASSTDPNPSNNSKSATTDISCPVPPQCSDGIDNDSDGATDYPDDFSCDSPEDDDESDPLSQCQDSFDNDNDGETDFDDDPGCYSFQDNDERDANGPECDNGFDDDNDGLSDYPDDPGCDSPYDDDERNYECSDGIDNDSDGAIDYPDDFSCDSPEDDDESNPLAQCQDGLDNDSDGETDYPDDPGCFSQQDDDERDPNGPECDNGFDDDSDGEIDYPDDPECDGPDDDSEQAEADLKLKSKIGPSNAMLGETIEYEIKAKNLGPDQATNVVVADVVPTGFAFNSTESDPDCILNGSSVLCDNFDLNSGQTKTFTVAFDVVSDNLCDTTVTNTATVSASSTDPNPGNNSKSATTDISCPVPPECSDGIDNDYDGAADYPDDFSCDSPDDDDESDPEAQCQDGVDNDQDGYTDYPQDPGCDSYQDDDEFHVFHADLSITKSGPSSAGRGQTVSYTLKAKNNGPDTATNVVVADPIPAGLTFNASASSTECIQQGTDILCNNLNLANGASRYYTIAFSVPTTFACNGTIENAASVSASSTDPNSYNNQSNQVVTFITCAECSDGIDNDQDGATDYPYDFSCTSPDDDDESNPKAACQDGYDNDQDGYTDFPNDPGCNSYQDDDEFNVLYADLSVVKSGVVSIHRGSTLLYTITTTNHGPDVAKNVIVGDWIPSGLTFNASQSDTDCVLDGGKVLCDNLNLANGQSRTYFVAFDVPATIACDTLINNSVHVSASSTDPNSSNNVYGPIYTEVTCVECNDGVDNDHDGAVDYPNDFSCSSVNDDDESYPKSKCQDGVDNDHDGYTDYPQDPGCDSLQDDDETNAPLGADLSITKYGPVTVQHGQTALYTLNVHNNGPATATNVVAADPVPNGMTFNPSLSDPACILQAGDVLCNNLNLTNGASKSYTVAFNVTGVSCGASVLNSATVSASSTDPNSGDNAASVLTTVQCTQCNDGLDNDLDGAIDYPADFSCDSPNDDDERFPLAQCQDGIDNDGDQLIDYPADPGCNSRQDNDELNTFMSDLSITKTGPSTVQRGNTVIYTLLVTNAGPDTANNVVAADPIPAGLTFNAGASDTACIQQGADILCNNLSLANGVSRSYTLAFNVLTTVSCNFVIQNAASVSTSSTDPNPFNNQSMVVQTNVTCTECSDGVDNDHDGATDYPADFSCTSPDDDDESSPLAQCQDGIDNDGDQLIDYPADPGCSSAQDNDEFHTFVSDLSITKSGPSSVQQGGVVTYSLYVTNHGPEVAENVVAADPIPAGLTFNASESDANCVQQGSDILCDNVTLTNGGTKKFVVAFDVPSTAACDSIIQNSASVSTSSTDPNPANNQSQIVQTTVQCSQVDTADLSITKSGPDTVLRGSVLTYGIIVINSGPDDAQNVVISDPIPAGLSFNSQVSSSFCLQQGNDILCTRPISAKNSTEGFNIAFNVPHDAVCDSVFLNSASVSTSSTDPDSTNNQSNTVQTTVQCPVQPTFTITKTDNKTTVKAGETSNYAITVTNTSTVNATNVSVTDSLPTNTSFLTASDSGTNSNGVVTWTGLSIAAGASKTLTLTVRVNNSTADGTILTNYAFVQDQQATDTTTVQGGGTGTGVQLTLTLDDSVDPVEPCQTYNYNVRITNLSSQTAATNIEAVLSLDNDTTFVSAGNGGTHSNGIVRWTGMTVPAGSTLTRTATVKTSCDANDNEILRATAIVDNLSDTEDTRVDDGGTTEEGDVTINITDDTPDPVDIGEVLTYNIRVCNEAEDDTEVDVTAFIDSDTSFLSASDGGDEEDDDEILWENFDLNGDSCETLVLRVRVRTSAEEDSTLRLRARVGDEEDTENTRVIGGIIPPPPPPFDGPATLSIDKSVDRREVQPGSIATYTLTIRNTSQYTASDIEVEDSFTAGSFTVEDAAGGNVLGNTIRWNVPALGPNATRVIRYRVRIAQTMRHGQTISNSVIVRSPDIGGSPSDVENISVIEYLPQTGLGGFLGSLSDSDSTIRPHARGGSESPYSLPLLIWTNIIAIGMSGGWLFGRKLFFY